MCSYGISTQEIAEALDKALNELEGDFTEEQLQNALATMKKYPYVSDKKKSEPSYKFSMRCLEKQ